MGSQLNFWLNFVPPLQPFHLSTFVTLCRAESIIFLILNAPCEGVKGVLFDQSCERPTQVFEPRGKKSQVLHRYFQVSPPVIVGSFSVRPLSCQRNPPFPGPLSRQERIAVRGAKPLRGAPLLHRRPRAPRGRGFGGPSRGGPGADATQGGTCWL